MAQMSEVFEGPVSGWAEAVKGWDHIESSLDQGVMRYIYDAEDFVTTSEHFATSVSSREIKRPSFAPRGAALNGVCESKSKVRWAVPGLTTAMAVFALTTTASPTASAANGSATKAYHQPLRFTGIRAVDTKFAKSALAGLHESGSDASADADRFQRAFDGLDWLPKFMSQDDELAYEWADADRHAIVSFEGQGRISYAMLVGGRFVAGADDNASCASLPEDLRQYLTKA